MSLTNMKVDDTGPECCAPNPYGYGLVINLTEEQCEALGITTPPTAGASMGVRALATVITVTQSVEAAGDDAGPDVRMSLQITDLELTPEGARPESATMLYGGE